MGVNYTTPWQARDQGRNAALAGREIFVNPHLGIDAEAWFAGYREVPEAERGTRPELLPKARLVRKRRARGQAIGQGLYSRARAGRAGKQQFNDAIGASVAEAEARMPKPWSEL